MADVKWIKIVTDVFDDEKILMIETMPECDTIIVIWFKLLCLAGKQNNGGVFQMGQMPYTDEMFSAIFRRPINTVRMALTTFEKFGMIEIIRDTVTIPNWGKHQSLDAYEKKKLRDRERVARKRAEQKALIALSPDMSPDTSPDVASLDRDIEEDKDIDIEKDNISIPKSAPKKPVKHKHGEYSNVLLTDDEFGKLQEEFPDCAERIERLSSYIASTGKAYKSHYATIRNWARKDAQQPIVQPRQPQRSSSYTDTIMNRVKDVDNW